MIKLLDWREVGTENLELMGVVGLLSVLPTVKWVASEIKVGRTFLVIVAVLFPTSIVDCILLYVLVIVFVLKLVS